MKTQDLAIRLSETLTIDGYSFDCQPIPGDVDVLKVIAGNLEEFPVYISISETQILCITYLWMEEEVDQSKRTDMLETMIDMNIPMPLSSFSRVGNRYVLFGALSVSSSFDEVVNEILTLSENSVDVISAMEDFLN
jgi:uncharacterized protein